jgi:Holliday junction resolvase RusA-like endonuclease
MELPDGMALLLQDAEAGAVITFSLPYPVSVNAMYADGKTRRFKSQAYCDWLLEAGYRLNQIKPSPVKGQYHVTYTFQEKADGRHRDAFNLEKGVTDLLVKHGVVEGDSNKFLRRGIVEWDKSVVGVRVTITPLSVASESVEASPTQGEPCATIFQTSNQP